MEIYIYRQLQSFHSRSVIFVDTKRMILFFIVNERENNANNSYSYLLRVSSQYFRENLVLIVQ